MTNSAQSTTFNYFVGSGLVLTDSTKTTADLVPLQLGIFNSKNYKALANQTSAKAVPEIIIAMGSPNTEKIDWTNSSMSFKSVPIRADRLIAWRKSTPKKALNHKVAIGWDGTSDCKTITAECDETYTLFVQVDGSPATRYFGGAPLTGTYVVNTGCCTDCVSGCSADVEGLVDNFVGQINKDRNISPFIKAEKIVSYTTAPTATTVAYESYTLSILDEGGIADLALVQATYPDAEITRTSRVGNTSVYTLIQIGTDSAPADFSNKAITVISNCSDCPSGYSLVNKTYKYKVQKQDTGLPANLSTIASGYSDANAYRLSYINGESTYVVHNTTGIAPAAVVPGDIVTYIGYDSAHCNLTTPSNTTWVAGKAYYKEVRELCLALGDGVCDDVSGTSQLAAITAFYSGNSSVVSGTIAQKNNGTCANSYTISQYSNNLMEVGCTTDIATFDPLTSFNNSMWVECCDAESTAGVVDKIGIILTGAYVDTEFGDCSFKYDDFVELDLPKIIVAQGDFVELENKCSKRWDVTELQAPRYPTGIGKNVLKDYIDITSTKGQRWSDDPRWREIYGYNYEFIKKNSFYKHFYLEFEALDKYFTSTGFGGNDFKQTIVFAFEENVDTTKFEKLLESWINSARPDLVDSDNQDNLFR